jgi:hypothetical protein
MFNLEVNRETIVRKEAGSWYILFNSSSLVEWEVAVYVLE